MSDTAPHSYLFQCQGEDLYAVSPDITGANIPRSPCTQRWIFCEQFELGSGKHVPAPILAEPILKGIEDHSITCGAAGAAPPSVRPSNVIQLIPRDDFDRR